MIQFPESVKYDDDFLHIVWTPQYLDSFKNEHHSFRRFMFNFAGITGDGPLYTSTSEIAESLIKRLYRDAVPSNVIIRRVKLPDTAKVEIQTRAL